MATDGERKGPGDSSFRALVLAGSEEGLVKRLPGFDRKRHAPPKRASERAQAFLERLVEPELEVWTEERFRALREAMGYLRSELEAEVAPGASRLVSKSFVLERRYALIPQAPERYEATTELSGVESGRLLRNEAFGTAVGPCFDRARLLFRQAVSVESVIDAIEGLDGGAVRVDYPPGCDYCEARIEGVEATFRFEPAFLEARFPGARPPGPLADALARLRASGPGTPLEGLLREE